MKNSECGSSTPFSVSSVPSRTSSFPGVSPRWLVSTQGVFATETAKGILAMFPDLLWISDEDARDFVISESVRNQVNTVIMDMGETRFHAETTNLVDELDLENPKARLYALRKMQLTFEERRKLIHRRADGRKDYLENMTRLRWMNLKKIRASQKDIDLLRCWILFLAQVKTGEVGTKASRNNQVMIECATLVFTYLGKIDELGKVAESMQSISESERARARVSGRSSAPVRIARQNVAWKNKPASEGLFSTIKRNVLRVFG